MEGIPLIPNSAGKFQAGLRAAWEMLAHFVDGEPRRFMIEQRNQLMTHLSARNQSILAHGYAPITEPMWASMSEWIESAFLPMLRAAAEHEGLRLSPGQLPVAPFWHRP